MLSRIEHRMIQWDVGQLRDILFALYDSNELLKQQFSRAGAEWESAHLKDRMQANHKLAERLREILQEIDAKNKQLGY